MLPWINKNQKWLKAATIGLLFLVVAFLFLEMVPVQAQQTNNDLFGLKPVEQTTILAKPDIRLIIARIIRAVLGLLGIIALGIMLYAGYTIMTSEGNEEKLTQGKKIMINAVIGLAIILSAFAIAQFIINMLSGNTQNGRGGAGNATLDTFAGSGALGKVVKDHYPFRDQTEVPRNTGIVVTFFEPVDPSTIIENTNKDCWGADGKATTTCDFASQTNPALPYYGDCIDVNNDGKINRQTECDAMSTSSVGIFLTTSTYYASLTGTNSLSSKGGQLVQGTALTVYEDGDKKNNYTFVFKPYDFIGSETEDLWYTVRLTNNINNRYVVGSEAPGVFSKNIGRKDYEWNFQTNTQIDFTPPYVVDTYPTGQETGADLPARNSIVQINFNEPVDPTSVQGQVVDSQTGFTNVILNTNFGATPSTTLGTWKLSNRYRTLEFVSNLACGQNSCGDTMYCLPLDCAADNKNCVKPYKAVVRTADLMPGSQLPFEGIPFTGAMDMASNALDNDSQGKLATPHKPAISNPLLIGDNEKNPDNFYWDFDVINKIDRSAPFIEAVEPDIDDQNVSETAPLKMHFSSRMWSDTLYAVKLEEHPAGSKGIEPIWFCPTSETITNKTVTELAHRAFGPNNTDLYYFPSVPATVKSLVQNCVYPGRGPIVQGSQGLSTSCTVTYNDDGTVNTTENCVGVESDSAKDTGCAQLSDTDLQVTSTLSECLKALKTEEVSPTQIFVEGVQ